MRQFAIIVGFITILAFAQAIFSSLVTDSQHKGLQQDHTTIQKDLKSQTQRSRRNHDSSQKSNKLIRNQIEEVKDQLSSFFKVNEANAASAPHYIGVREYPEHARNDVNKGVEIVTMFKAAQKPALNMVTAELKKISSSLERKRSMVPTLPREKIRVREVTLSHRRQMAVLIEVLRRSDAPNSYLAFADEMEEDLSGFE